MNGYIFFGFLGALLLLALLFVFMGRSPKEKRERIDNGSNNHYSASPIAVPYPQQEQIQVQATQQQQTQIPPTVGVVQQAPKTVGSQVGVIPQITALTQPQQIAQPAGWECQKCGITIRGDDLFCPFCGTKKPGE